MYVRYSNRQHEEEYTQIYVGFGVHTKNRAKLLVTDLIAKKAKKKE